MPVLGTRGAGSSRGFGAFGVEPNLYWDRSLGGSSQGQDEPGGMVLDSTNNIYLSSRNMTSGGSTSNSIQTKLTSNGTVLWQRSLSPAGIGYKIAIDSSGNTYYTGVNSNSPGNMGILIFKYDSSGALQWQRNLGSSSSFGKGIGCDSSGNVYVFGQSNTTGSGYFEAVVAKYNSSGTIQWQRKLGSGGSNTFSVENGTVDSSGNCYVVGYSGLNRGIIAKYNSSGTLQWQRTYYYDNPSQGTQFTKSMTVDSSGNIYAGVNWTVSDLPQRNIIKYNSSGVLQWQKGISISGGNYVFHGNMTTDSSGNVYATFGENSDSPFFIKFDSSGSILLVRKISFDNGGNGTGGPIFINSNGDICFAVRSANYGTNANRIELLKVPGDGSKTGSWTIDGRNYTYSVKTGVSFNTPSLTEAANSFTDSSISLSSTTSSLTEASASLSTGFSLI